MLAEAGRPRASHVGLRVAVIVALGVERGCLREVGARTLLAQSGPGADRAAAAAQHMLAAGAGALLSFGLAGGLAADAAPGRLLLPRRVVTPHDRGFDIDPGWHARLALALCGLGFDDRPLLAADGVLATPASKRAAAALGTASVDLESGAIAAVAAAAAVPFAVVRAVADGPGDRLPPGVSGWVDANGETRLAPVIAAALWPRNWPSLMMLGGRYRIARRMLEQAASRLTSEDFMLA